MKNLTSEMIEKAKAAKSEEELLALAKENNVEKIVDISCGNPKSLVLVRKGDKNVAYISNILSSTI